MSEPGLTEGRLTKLLTKVGLDRRTAKQPPYSFCTPACQGRVSNPGSTDASQKKPTGAALGSKRESQRRRPCVDDAAHPDDANVLVRTSYARRLTALTTLVQLPSANGFLKGIRGEAGDYGLVGPVGTVEVAKVAGGREELRGAREIRRKSVVLGPITIVMFYS